MIKVLARVRTVLSDMPVQMQIPNTYLRTVHYRFIHTWSGLLDKSFAGRKALPNFNVETQHGAPTKLVTNPGGPCSGNSQSSNLILLQDIMV